MFKNVVLFVFLATLVGVLSAPYHGAVACPRYEGYYDTYHPRCEGYFDNYSRQHEGIRP